MAKTISELRNQSIQVRDASAAGENTATRVGTVLNDIVGHIEDYENTQSSNNSSQDAKIEGVKSSLNAEIARAKTEESNLSNQIDTERTERQAAVSREETARIQADNDEKTAREQADNAEQDARIKADNDEKTARENADITLRTMIQTEVSNRQIAVKQEEIRAKAAEEANAQAIEDETARATTAEAAETARAKAEEERLQGEIDNTNTNVGTLENKVNSNHDHLTDEVARLDLTDNEIKADIEAETARAQAAEQANAQAIMDEVARAKTAEEAIIYDVSAHNDGAVFESISALLGNSNLDTLIPVSFRHGGMTIIYIQTSVNKYVQYRLMTHTFSTDEDDWQGVDDVPTPESNNLVKSGGVADKISELDKETLKIKEYSVPLDKKTGFWVTGAIIGEVPTTANNPFGEVAYFDVNGLGYVHVNKFHAGQWGAHFWGVDAEGKTVFYHGSSFDDETDDYGVIKVRDWSKRYPTLSKIGYGSWLNESICKAFDVILPWIKSDYVEEKEFDNTIKKLGDSISNFEPSSINDEYRPKLNIQQGLWLTGVIANQPPTSAASSNGEVAYFDVDKIGKALVNKKAQGQWGSAYVVVDADGNGLFQTSKFDGEDADNAIINVKKIRENYPTAAKIAFNAMKNQSYCIGTEVEFSWMTKPAPLPDAELVVPPYLTCVAGTETNIYLKNVLLYKSFSSIAKLHFSTNMVTPYRAIVNPTDTVSKVINAKFELFVNTTMDNPDTYSMPLRIVPKNTGSRNVKVLVIGDSKVAGGYISNYLKGNFTDDSMSITLLGTLYNWEETNRHEGRGGWTTKKYCTDASPFLLNNEFNFSHYMDTQGYDSVDYIFINLGTNDVAQSANEYIYNYTHYLDIMIASIHAYNPNINIVIGMNEGRCTADGDPASDFLNWDLNQKSLLLHKIQLENYSGKESQHIYLCPMYMGIDLDEDYKMSEVSLSKWDEVNNTGKKRLVVTDPIHQSPTGYGKNADYMYNTLKYIESLS